MKDGASDFARDGTEQREDTAAVDAALGEIREALRHRYDVMRELGRGGAAIVYLANDREHARLVALKVLREELAAAVSTMRFLREVDIGRHLKHPRIVPIFESGEVHGRPYYAMPYFEGNSLRERLRLQRQLPIEEALTITAQIAEALDSAHSHGIVHRDIKPGNILFGSNGVMVADFGIARAVTIAGGSQLTDSGLALGTPAYMSPEQAAGERELIDGRADVYALGCVLYEMLAGEPPFTGATTMAVVARHLAEEPRSLRIVRPSVPPAMQATIARALAKVPADRFATAGDLAKSLAASVADVLPTLQSLPKTVRTDRWILRSVAGALLFLLGAGALVRADGGLREWRSGPLGRSLQAIGLLTAPALDSALIAVIALDSEIVTRGAPDVATIVRGAFSSWRELSVADPHAVADARERFASVPRSAASTLSGTTARRIALSLGAGLYVSLRTIRTMDSLEVLGSLFDTRTNAQLTSARMRIAAIASGADLLLARFADTLLFQADVPHAARGAESRGTRSFVARRAFLEGHRALENGSFLSADSLFFDATRADSEYGDALLWFALVRSWVNSPDRPWRQLVERAARVDQRSSLLSSSDRLVLRALELQAIDRSDLACDHWSRLTIQSEHDFAAWYGLGFCLRSDSAVVRDRASPTGWRFRASYEQSVRAYERAFRLRPSLLRGLGSRSLADLQHLFFVSSARFRLGRATGGDTTYFRGVPEWRNDSITFVSVPMQQASLIALPEAVVIGVQRQRERFHAVMQMWRAEFPHSAEAAEAVAFSLEMLGDARALDTLRMARTLAATPTEELRLAGGEVLLRLKFAFPWDLKGLAEARRLADSLLKAQPANSREQPQLLGTLAAMLGRANQAAGFARAIVSPQVPLGIAENGQALLAFAALGGPADSLRMLEELVEQGINALPASTRQGERVRWLMRPGTLAYPEHRLASLESFAAPRYRTGSLIAAATRGHTLAVRQSLARITEARRALRPADLTIDGLLPEAAALAAIGDINGSVAWLDPTLGAIRFSASHDIANPTRIGPLIRSAVLRASLAERAKDPQTARLWARAVVALWSGADEFLQPTVSRMARLAR